MRNYLMRANEDAGMLFSRILRLMLNQHDINAINHILCKNRLSTMAASKVRTVLVDLSGTLHVDEEEIPGSIDAVNRLSQAGVNLKFVTNTTKESKRCLLDRLTSIGFNVQPSQIFTSLTAARHLLERTEVRPFLMLDRRALEDFEGLDTTNPNAVLIGLAPDNFDYQTMNKAFRLIMDGASLVAIHKARYYKRTDGLALGPAFGDKEIKFLMKHFEGRFQDLEPDALLTEWRKLKTIVYQRYRSPREIETLEWCSVHKATKYQGVEDVLSLIDLILSLPPTSVCNERSFSHMKLIKGGPFVTALEYATDTKAHVVGKPEQSFFLSAIEDFNCQPEECIMIGDDVRDDIGGAMATGMSGILVKTGKYRDGDEKKIDPKPTYIADNFSGAVDYILQML